MPFRSVLDEPEQGAKKSILDQPGYSSRKFKSVLDEDSDSASLPKKGEARQAALEDTLGIDALAQGSLDVLGKAIDNPLSRTLMDLVSRPGYAMAGSFEASRESKERGEGMAEGLAASLKRAGSELFSGLPGVQGEKRAFGEVFERVGYGEMGRVSQLAPLLYSRTGDEWLKLEQGGMADPTGRGALGLAADIFGDPTTYLTLGAKAGVRVVTKTGDKYLSKAGSEVWQGIQKKYMPEMQAALAETDDTLKYISQKKVYQKQVAELEPFIEADKKLLHPGGVRMFGQTIVPAEELAEVSSHIRDAVLSVPGGDKAIKGAAKLSQGAGAAIRGLFSPRGALADLPPGMQEAAFMMRRDFTDANTLIQGKLFGQWAEMEPEWKRLVKKDPKLGEKFTDIREGTAGPLSAKLTQRQQALYDKWAGLYDQMENVAEKTGILEPDQLALYKGRYVHHAWKNKEELSEVATSAGRGDSLKKHEKFQREREFATVREGIDVSRSLNKQSMDARMAGKGTGVYPVLEPDYDVMKNLGSYIHQHAEAVSRKLWYEDVARVFGKRIDDHDPLAIYEMTRARVLPEPDTQSIASFFGEAKNLRALAKEAAGETGGTAGKHVDFDALMADASRVLPKLSGEGKQAFLSELMTRTKSGSQAARLMSEFGETYKAWFPTPKMVKTDDIEPSLAHFGDQARYQKVSGSLWGEKPLHIPRMIVQDIEQFNTKILESRFRPAVQAMFAGYDWVNNWFKTGTYGFWPLFPASVVRDAYSNVAASFLDIGVGALRRAPQTARVLRGTSDVVKIGVHEYSGKQWKQLSQMMNVTDPKGRSFVQMTGFGEGTQYKPGGWVSKVVSARATVDNWSRTQLWLNNIAHGLSPRDAADKVSEFLVRYGELSAFERDVMLRAVPYYQFPRRMVELHVRLLGRKPGLVAAEMKPFMGRNEENEQLVSWEANALKLRLDRDGKTVRMLTGIDLPIRSVDTLWAGKRNWQQWGGSLSPLLKMGVEKLSGGVDPWTGQKKLRANAPVLGRAIEGLNTPQAVKDWLGYKKDHDAAGRPVYTLDNQTNLYLLLRSWAFSRVLTSSDRQFREYFNDDNPQVGAAVLDFLTGMRLKELDLDEQKQRKVSERIRQLEEIGLRKGKLKEFKSTYRPKE